MYAQRPELLLEAARLRWPQIDEDICVIEHMSRYAQMVIPVCRSDGLGRVTVLKEKPPAGFRQMKGWGFTGLPPWPDAELHSRHPFTGVLVIWLKERT